MRRVAPLLMVATLLVTACQQDSGVWFTGDFAAAKARAGERDTLVMLDFYTDWCSWCKRLSEDTFPAPVVATELAAVVPLKVNAEKGGEELAKQYAVDGYPTVVFVNAQGDEVDRIVGFLPPEDFAEQMKRIRTGDTFAACLKRLDADPADAGALERGIEGLLERSDLSGAVARLEAFAAAAPGGCDATCRSLMFQARSELHLALYGKAAKAYQAGSDQLPEVPEAIGTARLDDLLATSWATLSADDQAAQLRASRSADAADVLALLAALERGPDDQLKVADFAYRTGHVEVAASAYRAWFDQAGAAADAAELNQVAWRLYLMGRTPQLAVEIGRAAYARDASPDVADTLARALYVSGATAEGIALQKEAAAKAEGQAAEDLAAAARRMEAGEPLGDLPVYEQFPGTREG